MQVCKHRQICLALVRETINHRQEAFEGDVLGTRGRCGVCGRGPTRRTAREHGYQRAPQRLWLDPKRIL